MDRLASGVTGTVIGSSTIMDTVNLTGMAGVFVGPFACLHNRSLLSAC